MRDVGTRTSIILITGILEKYKERILWKQGGPPILWNSTGSTKRWMQILVTCICIIKDAGQIASVH